MLWEHELFIAQALANAGYEVKFEPEDNTNHCADAYVDGILFEFKSPNGKNIACVERNLKRGTHQSENIVLASCRIHRVQDRSIQRMLIERLRRKHGIKRIIFVNRSGEVVDINELIK